MSFFRCDIFSAYHITELPAALLCSLQDIVDPVVDQQLALFVVNSHIRSHPDAGALDGGVDDDDDDDLLDMLSPPGSAGGAAGGAAGAGGEEGAGRKGESLKDSEPQPLDQQMLKKYITYARAHCKPILHDIDSEKVSGKNRSWLSCWSVKRAPY